MKTRLSNLFYNSVGYCNVLLVLELLWPCFPFHHAINISHVYVSNHVVNKNQFSYSSLHVYHSITKFNRSTMYSP